MDSPMPNNCPTMDTSTLSVTSQSGENRTPRPHNSFGTSECINSFGDNEIEKKYVPHASSTDEDKCKSMLLIPPTSSQSNQKRKSVTDLFPWLNEVTKINQKCLGSITELRSDKILSAMDFLIG